MSPVILFVVLLLATFGIAAWAFSLTKTESAVQRHLKEIASLYTVGAGETSILKRQSLSSIPRIDRLLRLLSGAGRLQVFIAQAGSTWTVGTLLLLSLLLSFFVAWLVHLLVPILPVILLLAAAAGFLPYAYLFMKRRARFRRFEALLPDAIDLIARAMRAGHSIMSAIEIVSEDRAEPLSSEFRRVFEEQNLGLPLREAIENLVERMPLDDARFLATAVLVQKETGGNLAEVLDKTSAVMRDRIRLKGQLRVYTAQARMTGWALCLLPFIVFAITLVVNPDYEKALWTDPIGIHLVYAALVMMALGIFAIRKIINVQV